MRYSVMELQAFANQIYGGRPLVMTPYGYTVTFSGVTASSSLTQTLSITANADFILTQIKSRTSDSTLQTISNKNAPYYRLLVVDSGTNEQFTNSAVDTENFTTNGNTQQGLLPYPRFIAGRTSLTLTLSEYRGVAATQNIDVFLEGLLCRTYSGT